jgi:arginine N-succinyltransferase
MLPDNARSVMGVPHPSGRAAMKMLEREGFGYDGYVDIFDGGPTMCAQTDSIRTVRDAREYSFGGVTDEPDGHEPMMLAAGRLTSFAACYGRVHAQPDGSALLDAESAALLGIAPGDTFLAIGR